MENKVFEKLGESLKLIIDSLHEDKHLVVYKLVFDDENDFNRLNRMVVNGEVKMNYQLESENGRLKQQLPLQPNTRYEIILEGNLRRGCTIGYLYSDNISDIDYGRNEFGYKDDNPFSLND